ncbi:hypothetical protein TNCV_3907731 [Trichonephila clavipes]|nr:hypothetical protein TNCV_3907731 [Trichonephila clavipes]
MLDINILPQWLGGRGSRGVKVLDRGWPGHEFEASITKDPPFELCIKLKLSGATAHEGQSLLCPSQYT